MNNKTCRFLCMMALAAVLFSCSTPEKHQRRGDVFFAHGEYYDAAAEYKQAYTMTQRKDREARGMRAFLMGECYRHINSVSKAEGAYRNAVRYGYVDTTTYFHLAEAQLMSGNYKNALKNFELYLNLKPDDKRTLAGIESCTLGPEMKKAGSTYSVHAMPMFTSRRADYSPVLFGEKYDQLVFTSTRPQATGDDESAITGMKNGDLFYTSKDDKGKWKQVDALEGSVNTAYDEGACAVTSDGHTMYLTVCGEDAEYPRYAEIHSSARSDATWSKPQKVELTSDTLSSYAHPAVSPDGQWLYFVSDMPGGIGGFDIWRAQLDAHGVGAIENLGEPINSEGDEMFPTFRPNGDLYFSSNGKPGMGGLDIYCAKYDSVSNFWSVEILPSPVNSSGDDFGMTFEGVHNRGYFSSNRHNGRGWDHIYSFECPEIVHTIEGWVYEQDGYELTNSVVYMVGNDGTNLKFGVRSDGSFEQVIQPGVKYVLLATCDGFLNYKQEIQIDEVNESTSDTLFFPLPSVNSPVLVRNVFYEFNSAKLTDDSREALDNLVRLLNDNANITIELSSHCDYRGNELYNRKLSQHRAESVVDYLIKHGISPARLSAVGYGKLRPKVVTKKLASIYKYLNEGDTLTEKYIKKLKQSQQDTCNALNRRTEFKVMKTTYGLVDNTGEIDPKALLSGKAPVTKKVSADEIVKVYVPTPAEAAAADGKKFKPSASKTAKNIAKGDSATATKGTTANGATTGKTDSKAVSAAKKDASAKAAASAKGDSAKATKGTTAKGATTGKTDSKAATAAKKDASAKAAASAKGDSAKATKGTTAKGATTGKTDSKAASAAKKDASAKAAASAKGDSAKAAKGTTAKGATTGKTDSKAATAAKKDASAKAAASAKGDSAKATKGTTAKGATTGKTDSKAATAAKKDASAEAAASAKGDSAKATKGTTGKTASSAKTSKNTKTGKAAANVAKGAAATAGNAAAVSAAKTAKQTKNAAKAASSTISKASSTSTRSTVKSASKSSDASKAEKAAAKAKKDSLKAAKKAAQKAHKDSLRAAKESEKAAKAKSDSIKSARQKAAKAASKASKAVKNAAATTAANATSKSATSAAKKSAAASAKGAASATTKSVKSSSSASKSAVKSVKSTGKAVSNAKSASSGKTTASKSSASSKSSKAAAAKAKKDSVKAAKAAAKKAKAEAKKRAKAAKRKAKAAAKARADSLKLAKRKSSKATVSVRKTRQTKASSSNTETTARSAAKRASASSSSSSAAKSSVKTLTPAQRKAIQDSIIAKAKRDVEEEKAKKNSSNE